jgi:hypothetical protein
MPDSFGETPTMTSHAPQAPQVPQVPTAPPPATPALPASLQGTDVASLQAQVGELRIQLSGLRAQWSGLKSQLDQMLRSNPARPGVQQQWADVGVKIAQTEGDIAQVQARIAQKQGIPGGSTSYPSGFPRRSLDPNVALTMVAVMFVVAVVALLSWSKRARRGTPQTASLPFDQASRLERMEQALDAIAIEVERVAEGQRFVTKILAEAPARNAARQASDASVSDDKEPLALGAGPAETIRTPEREGVRQRVITPN